MRRRFVRDGLVLVGILWIGIWGCRSVEVQQRAETLGPHPEEVQTSEEGDEERPVLTVCFDAPLPDDLEVTGFERRGARLSSSMSPRHSASDIMTTPGHDITLDAEFSYGPMAKDLEHEVVEVWIDRCSDTMELWARGATDDDGEIHIDVAADDVPDIGEYRLLYRLPGDDSLIASTLRVYPEGTQLVVFDIDGTLTTGHRTTVADAVGDIGRIFGWGSYMPSLRDGAVEVTRTRVHEQGYVAVYLTGRPFWMTESTRIWMQHYGFARGHLRTTSGWGDWVPSHGGVGAYKVSYMHRLRQRGFEFVAYYGNTQTDEWAYRILGGLPHQMYFVGDYIDGTTHLGDGYMEHVQMLEGSGQRASQPFRYPAVD